MANNSNSFTPLDEIYLDVFREKVAEYSGYELQNEDELQRAWLTCMQLKSQPMKKSASLTNQAINRVGELAQRPELAPYLDAARW